MKKIYSVLFAIALLVGIVFALSSCGSKTYTITYNLNGGTNSSDNPESYSADDLDIILANPYKDGHSFVAWYEDAEFTKPVDIIDTERKRDLVLYAKWISYSDVFTYTQSENGLIVTGYNKALNTTVEIPDNIGGYPVVGISNNFFKNNTNLEHVVMPDSAQSIGDYAFSGCTSLKSISFGANSWLTDIGEYAFSGCTSLASIEIPSSVQSIGNHAFESCTSLASIEIPSSVQSIGEFAFYECTGLEEIYFNATAMNDLTSGNYVFYNAGNNGNGIKVVIGKNVTKIPAYLFNPYNYSSDALKILSVEFEDGSVCTSIGGYAFYKCTSLTSVSFGANSQLTSIGSEAFENCTSLASIDIPESVQSIGYRAFYGCKSLASVTFKNTSGWWRSSSSTATSGTAISESDLSNTSTAATYLKSTYYDYYWRRS